MTGQPDLSFRQLAPNELDLALSLAGVSVTGSEDTESFGLDRNGAPPPGGSAWGLFMRDILSAAAWFESPLSGPARVTAVAVPHRKWKMGLTAFILQELAKTVPGRDVVITIREGGRILGETLEEAGFTGPDAESEGYPAGKWIRAGE